MRFATWRRPARIWFFHIGIWLFLLLLLFQNEKRHPFVSDQKQEIEQELDSIEVLPVVTGATGFLG